MGKRPILARGHKISLRPSQLQPIEELCVTGVARNGGSSLHTIENLGQPGDALSPARDLGSVCGKDKRHHHACGDGLYVSMSVWPGVVHAVAGTEVDDVRVLQLVIECGLHNLVVEAKIT